MFCLYVICVFRLILDVASNGVVQPLRLVNALAGCHAEARIKFVDTALRPFCEDCGMSIRVGLSQIRMLTDTNARDRCLNNVSRTD